ncbi:hypothetical protein D3C73_356610 [compost metagenome]
MSKDYRMDLPKQAAVDPVGTILEITRLFDDLNRWWETNRSPILKLAEWASVSLQRAQILEEAGWLPHYTTPDFPSTMAPEAACESLLRHYCDNWPTVEAAFRERLSNYVIDEEAKACFSEALKAHAQGLYRVAPRLLFPEIERLVRQDLIPAPDAGLRGVRIASDQLGLSNLHRSGFLSLRLYDTFTRHMYARAKTEEERARILADPVPNRHASLHGIVVYNSVQSSINALIMAEFVLLTVSALSNIHANADAPLSLAADEWLREGPYALKL